MFLKNFLLFDEFFLSQTVSLAILLHFSRTKNKFSLFDLLRRAGTNLHFEHFFSYHYTQKNKLRK